MANIGRVPLAILVGGATSAGIGLYLSPLMYRYATDNDVVFCPGFKPIDTILIALGFALLLLGALAALRSSIRKLPEQEH